MLQRSSRQARWNDGREEAKDRVSYPGQGHLLRVMKLGNVVRVRVLLFAVRSVCGVWLPVAHGGSFKASLKVFSVN